MAHAGKALLSLPKPMTPSIALSCGLSWLALTFHRERLPSSANSTTACGHARDWMASSRICSMWSRVFGKGVCSRHCCSTFFSRQCCAWRRNASPLMLSSWTAWCNSKERRNGGKRRGGVSYAPGLGLARDMFKGGTRDVEHRNGTYMLRRPEEVENKRWSRRSSETFGTAG